MESEGDLAARLTARLPIEEAEECLCQLEEQCITVDVLGEAEAQDLADELGFSARWCDAVLLDDEAWRARYGQERAGGAHANAHVAVPAMPHGDTPPDSDKDDGPGASSTPDKAPGAVSADAINTEHGGCGGAGPLTQEVAETTNESLPPAVHAMRVAAAENGDRQLIVTVQCPHAATADEVDLQVSATEICVDAQGQLPLLLPLQCTVDADSAAAKYNQKKRQLVVICKISDRHGSASVAATAAAEDCGKMCAHATVLQGMFKFGGIELFGRSLEEHLGAMSNDAVAGLYAEHEMAADSDSEFTAPNHPAAGTTTPRQEFRVVVGEDGVDTEKWSLNPTAEPTCGADARVPGRVVRPIAHYMRCEQVPRAALTLGEVIALRLFTGPMSAKYNKVLRETTLRESAAQPDAGLEAQVDVEGTTDLEVNTYSTTIGLIISGILKLGRIATAPRRNVKGTAMAYCGLDGLDLPPVLFTPDEQGFCGAVVPAFLSLSDDEAVADAYSGVAQGKVATIFELELSKGSLGAEVAWLSQFPKDQERLLPPWTHLQVVGSPTRRADRATVFRMRPTVFQNVRTVEEVAGARKEEIRAHIAGLVMDVRSQADFDWDDSMSQGHSQSPNLDSLIQRLAFAHRLAAFEQDLLARFCKYQAKWYDDNGKYKSTFLGVLREVNDARAQLADPASALSKRLASTVDSSAAGSVSGLPELSVGAKVEIHSLVRAPDLNGAKGEIVGPQDQGTGRWIVKIGEGRLVKLKSNNLRCMRAVDANSGDEVPASLSASKESPLHAALTLIKSEESLQIMEKLVRNCAESPGEEKFRKVRSTNEKIRACLGAEGAKSAMAAMGWVEQDDCLVLPPGVKLGMEEVNAIKTARSMLIKPTQSSSANAAAAIAPQGDAPASSSSGAVYRLHTKFFQDPTLFQDPSKSFCAKFGSDDEFAGGIQGKLGKMDLEFVKRMYFEHNRAHDAQTEFAYGNKGKKSTAQHEWRFVVGSHGVSVHTWTFDVERAEPEYTPEDLVEGRNAKPLRELMQLPRVKEAGLRVAEVVGLRLYSGPLFAAYNRVQRGFAKDGDTLYTTTAHLIKSGIFKLAMITAPPADLTLYRGTGNMALGPDFFKRDAQGFAGGVELGFMSATASRQVALEFAGMEAEEGKDATKQLPTLYVIDVGKMSIGANIADISQFEGEEEFVYPMLTRLELTKEPELSPDGTVSLIHLKLTLNQRSTTVEDAEQARRRFLTRLAHSLQWSLRNWARQRAGLTERLRPQIVGVLRRLLDEVLGAELAVLNTNEGYGQVFERIMRIWEEVLRQEVVEALWQDGEQQADEADKADADSAEAAVRRFTQAIEAARELCADSKDVRDRVVEMGRVKVLLTGGGKDKGREAKQKVGLANDLRDQGAYDEALIFYRQAVELYVEVRGQDHIDVANSRMGIGNVLDDMGKHEEALVEHQKALEVFVAVLGRKHRDVAASHVNIGSVYGKQGKYQEALVELQKASEVFLAVHGPEHLSVADSYNNIAIVYEAQGQYEQALEMYSKSLDIKIGLVGRDHLSVASSYNNIGNVCKAQGRYEEALDYYRRDLEITVRVVGRHHIDVARSYNNIALVYKQQGHYERALEMYSKSLDIKICVVGCDHPETASTYQNVGVVYHMQGNLAGATEMFTKAYRIFLKVLGPDHPSTLRLKPFVKVDE